MSTVRLRATTAAIALALFALPSAAVAAPGSETGGQPDSGIPSSEGVPDNGGGSQFGDNKLVDPNAPIPGNKIKIMAGKAQVPIEAPKKVQKAIRIANTAVGKLYKWGGGHKNFKGDTGYDCSGFVSLVLGRVGLIKATMVAPDFLGWGTPGEGTYITVWSNSGHTFMQFGDKSIEAKDFGLRIKWAPMRSTAGYKPTHWPGL